MSLHQQLTELADVVEVMEITEEHVTVKTTNDKYVSMFRLDGTRKLPDDELAALLQQLVRYILSEKQ